MLLSDRDLHEAITSGRLGLTPYDRDEMLQPASIDVRLDRDFRVFENHRHPC
ncbi:dCTP deaminase domain-containing protein, partial [Streptomyces olivaceoviridis]